MFSVVRQLELLSMTFDNLTRVYGTMARTIKTWIKVLNACESTVSPELVQWASELLTAPKGRYLADIDLFFCSVVAMFAVDSKKLQ